MIHTAEIIECFEEKGYSVEEMVEFREIFSSDIPPEYKAEMLQYVVGSPFQKPFLNYINIYENVLLTELRRFK